MGSAAPSPTSLLHGPMSLGSLKQQSPETRHHHSSLNEAGNKCSELYVVAEHRVVPLNCARGRESKSHFHFWGQAPLAALPPRSGPMPATIQPETSRVNGTHTPRQLPSATFPQRGLGLEHPLCFSARDPLRRGPRLWRGDPHQGWNPEILTVVAVGGCAWCGARLVAGLGAACWHGTAWHGPAS